MTTRLDFRACGGERETRRDAFGRAVERPHGRTPGRLAAWAISELTRAATVTVALLELYLVWDGRPISWAILGAAAFAFVALTLWPDSPDEPEPEDESRGGGSWLPEDEAWPKDDRPSDLDRGREIERPMLPPRF